MFGPAGVRRVPASLLLLTLALFGVAGWCIWSRVASPTDGATVSPANSAVSIGHIIVSAGSPGVPLELGDEVLAIDGQSLAERVAQLPGGAAGRGRGHAHLRRRAGRVRPDPGRHAAPLSRCWTPLPTWWPMVLVGVLLVATSFTVFWARPRDPAAHATLLTSAIGIVAIIGAGFFPLTALDLVAGDQFWRHFAGQVAFALLWGAVLHFAIAFPSTNTDAPAVLADRGGYVGPLVLYGLVWVVTAAMPPLERIYILAVPVLPSLFVYPPLIGTVLVRSYLRLRGEPTARPILWLLVALVGSTIAYFVIWVVPVIATGRATRAYEMQALPFMAVPIAMSLAVLRYRALNIEVAVSRTVVYGALTVGAVGVYFVVVTAWSALFGPITNVWWQAAIAAGIAVLSQPVRARLQHADQQAAVRRPGRPVPGGVRARVPAGEHADRVDDAAGDRGDRGRGAAPAAHGDRDPGTRPQRDRGERRHADRRAVPDAADVPRRAGRQPGRGPAVRAARADQAGPDRARRGRAARWRRRVHRAPDPGPAPQPRPAGAGAGDGAAADPARAARRRRPDARRGRVRAGREPRTVGDTTPTGELLGRLRDELQAAIVEIRRLAHGLRPPVLDRIGLIPAIREYAGALASRTAGGDSSVDGVTIVLEVPSSMPKLPAPVDVAAYRIICEALTNVTRHAAAKSCAVRLWVDDDLHIEVVDDGVGLPAVTNGGVGLSSMRERATELGGECLVEADHDGGTRVFATLPLPKEGS